MNIQTTKRLSSLAISGILSTAIFAYSCCAQDKTVAENDDLKTQDSVSEPKDEFELADLPPLKRLVLYNSGVGQLQHAGIVNGKTRLQIRFGMHDVDDVLRSLVFEDKGSGMVRAVEYQPAPEPEDVAAGQIGQPMTLAQLLQRFRGETINIVTNGPQLIGTIYGVENRARGENLVETLILMNEDGLQSVELNRISRMKFTKESIQEELRLAMSGLVKSRKANQKQLDLLLDGEGERPIQFAYVVDMPIWRMTYRIALDDDEAALQGWAHVDNVTGVDWKDVSMELRSGKPQTFHANVFSPLMVARPEVGTSVFEFTEGLALIGDMVGGGAERMGTGRGLGSGGGGFGGSGGLGGGGLFGESDPTPRKPRANRGMDVTSAFKTTATEGRASQMVQYVLDSPVNLGAGKSAALPVFAETLPAKKLSVYTDGEEVVFRAIQLDNTTDLPLVSGPVSIVGNGDFVGDGPLPRLNAGERAEIIYGVDRAIEINRTNGFEKRELIEIKIEKGKTELLSKSSRKIRFNAENKDTEQRNLIVHFGIASIVQKGTAARDLVFSPEPAKNEDGIVTYELEIDAQAKMQLEISVTRDIKEFLSFSGITKSQLREWEKRKVNIAAADLEIFTEFAEIAESISLVETELSKLVADKRTLESEQTRVRQNLEVVSPNPEASKVYLDQLQDLETKIQANNQEAKDAKTRLDELAKEKQAKQIKYSED